MNNDRKEKMEKTVEESTEKTLEESTEKTIEESTEKTIEESVEKTLEESVEKPVEKYQKDCPKIIKDLVVGFLIVRSKVMGGNSYVNIIPLNSSWDGFNDDHDIDANEEIVGVIPAPQRSYKILGLFPCEDGKQDDPYNGAYKTLGYEHQGAYYPDWEKLLEEKIENKASMKIENKELNII